MPGATATILAAPLPSDAREALQRARKLSASVKGQHRLAFARAVVHHVVSACWLGSQPAPGPRWSLRELPSDVELSSLTDETANLVYTLAKADGGRVLGRDRLPVRTRAEDDGQGTGPATDRRRAARLVHRRARRGGRREPPQHGQAEQRAHRVASRVDGAAQQQRGRSSVPLHQWQRCGLRLRVPGAAASADGRHAGNRKPCWNPARTVRRCRGRRSTCTPVGFRDEAPATAVAAARDP